MKKLEVHNPNVTCGSCRKFDGHTWCKHWNFFTTASLTWGGAAAPRR